jgi:hypothetical protein
MSVRDLVGKKIKGKKIVSPTNRKYVDLCLKKGNMEIRAIMSGYTEAMKEAGKIFVK